MAYSRATPHATVVAVILLLAGCGRKPEASTPAPKLEVTTPASETHPDASPPAVSEADKTRLAVLEKRGIEVFDRDGGYALRVRFDKGSDEVLKEISGIKPVTYLNIDSCDAVTDEGLKALTGLDSLDVLNITSCPKVTDTGVAAVVTKFPTITELTVADCPVGDATLKAVKNLGGLTVLQLSGTKVTDAGFAKIEAPKLKVLDLSNTPISDATGTKLSRFSDLYEARLSGTDVGDATIAALRDHPRLNVLHLTRTKVTSAAVEALRKSKPPGYVVSGPE